MERSKIQIFLLPYDSGHRAERMGAGPEYWIETGLVDFLRERGHEVQVKTVEAPEGFHTEVSTSFDLYRRLASQIQADCAGGGFPLVLSGNCGAALGGIAGLLGLDQEEMAVAWFDAHGDFHTPDTTTSGFLDGMGLATAVGLGWKDLARTLPGFRPVRPQHVIHIGGRDFDQGEERLFQEAHVNVVRAEAVHHRGARETLQPVVSAMIGPVSKLYLHLDADVLDPAETPTNHFPAPGGLFPDQAAESIRLLRESFSIRGMTVASFDPRYGSSGKTREAVFRLIGEAVG